MYDWYYFPYVKYSQVAKLSSSNVEALVCVISIFKKHADISSW